MKIVKPDTQIEILSDADGEDYYEVDISNIVDIDIDALAEEWINLKPIKLDVGYQRVKFSSFIAERIGGK
jgi:hypothetical protein